MLLLCYIILFILEPSMLFSVWHNYVTCDYNIYDYPITGIMPPLWFVTCVTIICNLILYSLSKSKIRKINRNENENEKRNKKSPLFSILTIT